MSRWGWQNPSGPGGAAGAHSALKARAGALGPRPGLSIWQAGACGPGRQMPPPPPARPQGYPFPLGQGGTGRLGRLALVPLCKGAHGPRSSSRRGGGIAPTPRAPMGPLSLPKQRGRSKKPGFPGFSACRKTLGGSGAAAPGGYNRIWWRVRQIRKKPCVARVSLHSSLAAP